MPGDVAAGNRPRLRQAAFARKADSGENQTNAEAMRIVEPPAAAGTLPHPEDQAQEAVRLKASRVLDATERHARRKCAPQEAAQPHPQSSNVPPGGSGPSIQPAWKNIRPILVAQYFLEPHDYKPLASAAHNIQYKA